MGGEKLVSCANMSILLEAQEKVIEQIEKIRMYAEKLHLHALS